MPDLRQKENPGRVLTHSLWPALLLCLCGTVWAAELKPLPSDSSGPVPAAAAQRPAAWAAPVKAAHLDNFYKLDDKVYRSAQPDKAGFKELESIGIKNVLSLRDYFKDRPGKDSKLNLYRVEMAAGSITTDQVVAALRLIKNAEGPVLLHCWHGSDRTGAVAAMYRVIFQDWPKDAAIDELVNGGYGYHAVYKNIPELVRRADIADIKNRVFAK